MRITGNSEQGAEYYDEVYERVAQNVVPRMYVVREWLTNLRTPSILDVGCGCGTLSSILPIDWKYRGFDFSEIAIAKATDDFPLRKFEVADVYDKASYEPIDYNVIVCGQVLEHTDDLKVLSSFPKGMLVIGSVPSFGDPAHIRYYESVEDVRTRFNEVLIFSECLLFGGNQFIFRGRIK